MGKYVVPKVVVLAVLAIVYFAYAAPALAGSNNVMLCHLADGNPHTILINENAVSSHLAHGDTEGPCGLEPPICGPGVTACGTTCSDLSTDENNCGACGFVCPTETYCVDAGCVEIFEPPCFDADGDGDLSPSCGGTDCNDLNASVYPGAEEFCDAYDNDCNGVVDDRDEDGDGHIAVWCAGAYTGPFPVDDCMDTDSSVYGTAPELCGDGLDNNCDGNIDEGCN